MPTVSSVFQGPCNGPYTEVLSNADDTAILLMGSIDDERILYFFEQLPDSVHTVSLESVGGKADIAMKIAQIIRDRKLRTYVYVQCISACTLMFQGGVDRVVSDDETYFVYHYIRWFGPGSENLPAFQRSFTDAYMRYGMSEDFAEQIASEYSVKRGKELFEMEIATEINLLDLGFDKGRLVFSTSPASR